MPETWSGRFPGTPAAAEHDDGGHGRGGEVVEVVGDTGEALPAARQVGERERLVAEPALVREILVGLLGEVERRVGQVVGPRDDRLAARERRVEVAQQGRQDGLLLAGVLRVRLAVLELDIAQEDAARPARVLEHRADVQQRPDLLGKVGRALGLEIDVVQADVPARSAACLGRAANR